MTWHRKWFFWMESLQITAGERRVIILLLIAGMITTGVARFGPSGSVYDQNYYKPVIAEFKQLSREQDSIHAGMLDRYYPNPGEVQPDHISTVFGADQVPGIPENMVVTDPGIAGSVSRSDSAEWNAGRKELQNYKQVRDTTDRDRIPIQTANKEDLMTLPGIGPVTAQRILDYREKNDSIHNLDDLMNVSGIGPVTIENIRDYIVFD